MKNIYFLLFLFPVTVNAQTETSAIFNKTANKINSLRSVSYSVKSIQKNPFSKGDVSTSKTLADVLFDKDGTILYKKEKTNINSGQNVFNEIYSDGKIYSVNLTDSTYTVESPKEPIGCELTDIASTLKKALMEQPRKTIQKKDTIFEGMKCYHFLIKILDIVVKGNRDYTHELILIDKKTMMPVYFKTTGEGKASKGGYSLGRLTFFMEKKLADFNFDRRIATTRFDSAGFSLPNTEMLKRGETVPELDLIDIFGKNLAGNNFTGRVLLVVFGATACPANPLANPMLNRLQTKFSSDKFSIVNVYTNETTAQVKKYIDSNGLEFPVYLGSRKLNREFKTLGTPNFYLIGTDGKVVDAIAGYSEPLEEELTGNIAKLLSKDN